MVQENVNKLRQIEKSLLDELNESPLFKQLEGIRATIKLFENGHSQNNNLSASEVPAKYAQDMKWNDKIFFALNNIGSGFTKDIVNELKKHDTLDEKMLLKKAISTIYLLKNNGKLKIIEKDKRRDKVAIK